MFNPVRKTFQFGGQEVTIETGKVARQATGAVVVTMGDTQVLATVVGRKQANPGQDFPAYRQLPGKTYAVGKIPGGFFKREGRPTEKTLTSRLIDRQSGPFPEGLMNEVQVICTVVSGGKTQDPDIAAMIGASASLAISGIPFAEPIGAARVGYDAEQGYVLNPNYEALEGSLLDMVVAGTQSAVLMVESEAKQLSEDQMLGAVLFAHQEMQAVINAINELKAEAGKPAWDWQPEAENTTLKDALVERFGAAVAEAYKISEKMQRYEAVGEIKQQAIEALASEEGGPSAGEVSDAFGALEKRTVRNSILDGSPRIDGRDTTTVRAIEVETGVLPKAHGLRCLRVARLRHWLLLRWVRFEMHS